jgi:hypothetical protein
MNWVTVKKFALESGYTADAIRAKIKRGIWLEGKHWKKAPDGRVLLNLREIEAWIEGKAA